MWVLPVNRRQLIDLLAPDRDARTINAVEELRPSLDIVRSKVTVAVWPADPNKFGRMPTAIICADGDRQEIMAWLSTYVRDFRPFTAYCRVVERPIAEQFLKSSATPTLHGMEGICAGLILGESLMHARGRASILDLPFSAYSATLSHAISRTYALSGGSISIDQIAKLWSQARELTGQSGLAPPNAALSVWAAALGKSRQVARGRSLFDESDTLTHAWIEFSARGELSDELWHNLVQGYQELEPMRQILDMPREHRVPMIDTALHILGSARGDQEQRSFLAGYLTSLLGPGTLDHAEFLTPVAAALPAAYLWYGLFAGVNTRGDALPVGNPLARRIVRDLTIPDCIIDRPRCDIALEELMMHGSHESLLKITSKAGRLDIDILPGVTTSVRWTSHESQDATEIQRARQIDARPLLAEMDATSARMRDLAERLRETLGLGGKERPLPVRKKRGGKD